MNRLIALARFAAVSLPTIGCSFGSPTPSVYSYVVGDGLVVVASIDGDHHSERAETSYTVNGVTHDNAKGSSTFVFPLKDLIRMLVLLFLCGDGQARRRHGAGTDAARAPKVSPGPEPLQFA